MSIHKKHSGRALVVSLHDVHPLSQERSDEILTDLTARGVPRCSLLVVPDFHQTAPIERHPEFLKWLKVKADEGHEVVLHGFTHSRRRRKKESPLTRWITRTYTAGEGEFYDISEATALSQLARGLGLLRGAGFAPEGFIAPAWLLSPEGENAARATGFQYTTRLGTVKHLPSRRIFRSQSLVYSVRNAWRRQVSLAWNAHLFSRLKNNPLVRLGLHPPDYDHADIVRQIQRITREALDVRVPMTYQEWVRDHFRDHV